MKLHNKNIIKVDNKNAYHGNNYMFPTGLSKTLSLSDVIKMAIDLNATAVCRSSPNSKWYLRNQSMSMLKESLSNNKTWPGMEFYIINAN